MKISVVSGAPDARTADVLVYAAFIATTSTEPRTKKRDKKKRGKTANAEPSDRARFGSQIDDVDEALGGILVDTATKEGFTGAVGQLFSLHTHGRVAAS